MRPGSFRILQILPIFILLQAAISCNSTKATKAPEQLLVENGSISEIGSSIIGGRLGLSEKLIIRADSTTYEKKFAARARSGVYFSEMTRREDWEKMTNSINLDLFKKIRNGESNQVFDGTDIIIYVKANNSIYSFTNGYADSLNYKPVQGLVDNIELKLNYFRKRS